MSLNEPKSVTIWAQSLKSDYSLSRKGWTPTYPDAPDWLARPAQKLTVSLTLIGNLSIVIV